MASVVDLPVEFDRSDCRPASPKALRPSMTHFSCAIIWIGCFVLGACSLQGAALTQDANRPGPPLDAANCLVVWRMAYPHGDVLSKDVVAPFVVDVTLVDKNHDGRISEGEFKDACEAGWVKAPSTPVCIPDGDNSLWPTFDLSEKCGSYHKCAALGQPDEANACTQQIDDCGVALRKSNEKADAHNSALAACRSAIPARQKAM
jgi:hypothetical protein